MSLNRPLAFQSLNWSHRARTAIRRAVRRRARDAREAYNEAGPDILGVIERSMSTTITMQSAIQLRKRRTWR